MRNEQNSDFCRVNNINEYFKNCSKSAYFKDFNSQSPENSNICGSSIETVFELSLHKLSDNTSSKVTKSQDILALFSKKQELETSDIDTLTLEVNAPLIFIEKDVEYNLDTIRSLGYDEMP